MMVEYSDEMDVGDISGSECIRGKPKSGKFWKSKKQRQVRSIRIAKDN